MMKDKQCGFCEDGVFETYVELFAHTLGDCPNFNVPACKELDEDALSTNRDRK